MSKKKLFSDRRWTEPIDFKVIGKVEVTKEERIKGLDFFLSQGIIDEEKYRMRLESLENEYSNKKSGDENADDK
ncbi:hypothetical protein [Anaerovibrio sp. RM50]|uniref:hypothetical protein n=1 Tax=Anaerovibrio sp. RM50 TaxID=1200557 RepID=UPI00047F6D2E|nr:hypothetical protein [Anaerovibrio sp. RM50]